MDFGFLFDPTRKLFSIGYRVTDGSLDPSCYDLLASEARLASFVAIAKGDVPVSHWFQLGRAADAGRTGLGARLLVGLDVRVPDARARDARAGGQPARRRPAALVVRRQIEYGAERGVPWGVSESAYNARDLELTYQYSNFGVPGLGLEARPRRRPRRRALRDRAGRDGRPGGRGAELLGASPRPAASGAVRLLRGARLHAGRGCRRARRWPSSAPTWRTTRA